MAARYLRSVPVIASIPVLPEALLSASASIQVDMLQVTGPIPYKHDPLFGRIL